jgi:hypothetical protein
LKKFTAGKTNLYFLNQKLQFTYSYVSIKDVQATGVAFGTSSFSKEARGLSCRGRIRGVEGENKRGGAEWLSSLIHLSGPSRVN